MNLTEITFIVISLLTLSSTGFSCCHLDNAWTTVNLTRLLLLSKNLIQSINQKSSTNLYFLTSFDKLLIFWWLTCYSLSAISNLGYFCDDCIMWNPCLVCVSWNLCDVVAWNVVKYVWAHGVKPSVASMSSKIVILCLILWINEIICLSIFCPLEQYKLNWYSCR